jgi:sugar (pentulose or hexulose) kinase
MQKQYLMGVDVGTQSAKVAIFDLDGKIICSARKPMKRLVVRGPSLAEHPDDDLWDALKGVLRQVMDSYCQDPSRDPSWIKAIGLCSIRCCRVLLKENGKLASPVINWLDKRLDKPYIHEKSYGEVRYVTSTSGYLTHRLTGEFKDTCANYIGKWPMDDETRKWSLDTATMHDSGLSREMLFDVVEPGEILGRLTSAAALETQVPVGTPVVSTAHDKAVEALGSGSLSPGTALISLGTYICAMVQGDDNKASKTYWPFQAAIPGKYLYECLGVRRGMWTISWFCSQFKPGLSEEARAAGLSTEQWFDQAAEGIPIGCEGLVTIHDWAPPPANPYRKGVMFGFDGRHSLGHMYRSLLEGIALTVKNHVDPMLDELGINLDKITISGGGSRSHVFLKIFADCLGIPVCRNRITDAAALGSAINAGVAVGAFASYDEAVDKMISRKDQIDPDRKNTEFYDYLNNTVYKEASKSFDPVLKNLSRIVD